jgi:hypothetical protein
MTRLGFLAPLAAAAVLLAPGPEKALAQGQFQIITGAQFDAAVVNSVNLEGKDRAVATRNAALLQSPSGTRAFLALTDATGYSSDVAAQKYVGVIVTEGGNLSIGGKTVGAGTYAFGWAVPPRGEEGPGTFTLYSHTGAKLAQCTTPRDAELKTPKPLQVVVLKNGTARLYYGRYSVELR